MNYSFPATDAAGAERRLTVNWTRGTVRLAMEGLPTATITMDLDDANDLGLLLVALVHFPGDGGGHAAEAS